MAPGTQVEHPGSAVFLERSEAKALLEASNPSWLPAKPLNA